MKNRKKIEKRKKKKSLRGLWDIKQSSTHSTGILKKQKGVWGKVPLNNNGWKFHKFYEKHKPTNSKISVDVKQENTKKTTLKYITVQHLNTENKEKHLDRSVSGFQFCITNHHKHRGLKQHPFIISQFFGSEIQVGSPQCSLDLTGLKSRCWLDWAPIWKLWGRIHSKFIQIVGKVQFFVV